MNPGALRDSLPVVEGEGVRLRPLQAADAAFVLELFGDRDIVRFMSISRVETLSDAGRFIEEIERGFVSGTLYQWCIETDGEPAGTVTLAGIDRADRRAEVGFAVLRRRWQQRILSRALPLLLRVAFERLGLERLEADVDPGNQASLRALERLGFRREGVARERHRVDGAARDAVMFGLLRREWR